MLLPVLAVVVAGFWPLLHFGFLLSYPRRRKEKKINKTTDNQSFTLVQFLTSRRSTCGVYQTLQCQLVPMDSLNTTRGFVIWCSIKFSVTSPHPTSLAFLCSSLLITNRSIPLGCGILVRRLSARGCRLCCRMVLLPWCYVQQTYVFFHHW